MQKTKKEKPPIKNIMMIKMFGAISKRKPQRTAQNDQMPKSINPLFGLPAYR
jgi:hypothetical protein